MTKQLTIRRVLAAEVPYGPDIARGKYVWGAWSDGRFVAAAATKPELINMLSRHVPGRDFGPLKARPGRYDEPGSTKSWR